MELDCYLNVLFNVLTAMPDYILVVFGCSNEASRAEGFNFVTVKIPRFISRNSVLEITFTKIPS